MNFEEYLATENIKFKETQTRDKEIVDYLSMKKAFEYLEKLRYEDVPSIYLGCASVNLLNTYVKEVKKSISYQFKDHLREIIRGILAIHSPGITLDYQPSDEGNVLIIKIFSVQFSFHDIKLWAELEQALGDSQIHEHIQWDGIRKQKCAMTVFASAFNKDFMPNVFLEGRHS
ncbi:MAG: hypothetical protein NTV44_00815 [Firmicutes bacterium]|nr:hypothetical protein [Bacillota bacterium]